MISDDIEIAETFNEFFVNIVPSLKISLKKNCETDVVNDNEPNSNYINKFKNHPSIKVIKSRKKEEQSFTFNYVSYEDVLDPLSTNFTKWSNTLKQFVRKLATNCLSVFDHFWGLVLKGLKRLENDKLLQRHSKMIFQQKL